MAQILNKLRKPAVWSGQLPWARIPGRMRYVWSEFASHAGSILDVLDHRFSVAPMMDWTGISRKAERDQYLIEIVTRRAVPNAVLGRASEL
jgi:hypothetical protein